MKKITKRSLALLLALTICLGLAGGLAPQAEAASYVANWGTRGEVATSLSSYAEAFYTGSYTFDNLIAHDGSHLQNQVPSSDLYKTLQTLMVSRHTHLTTYGDIRELSKYTDCENGNTAIILSFYSSTPFSSQWDQGKTWNREHVWPASKTLSGRLSNSQTGEAADILSIRPTLVAENEAENNAFGEGTGCQNVSVAVRGDVARILLYNYVRWGNSQYMWGKSGVIENLDTLLRWMEEDPVDTWEMGRNDAGQSITGTRNVFIDYPELAFLLFGQQVPEDMVTPSGEAAKGVDPNPPVTEPPVTQPTVTQPAVTQPSTTQPTVTQPATTKPTVTQPAATTPTVTQPPVTQPAVTQPSATEPVETEPIETEPDATEPSATQPPVTEPVETKPAQTESTQPSTTKPTVPSVTEPTATQPDAAQTPDTMGAGPIVCIVAAVLAAAVAVFVALKKKQDPVEP